MAVRRKGASVRGLVRRAEPALGAGPYKIVGKSTLDAAMLDGRSRDANERAGRSGLLVFGVAATPG